MKLFPARSLSSPGVYALLFFTFRIDAIKQGSFFPSPGVYAWDSSAATFPDCRPFRGLSGKFGKPPEGG